MKKSKNQMLRVRLSEKAVIDLTARATAKGMKLAPYVRSLIFSKKHNKATEAIAETKTEEMPRVESEIVATKRKKVVATKSPEKEEVTYRRFAPPGSLLKK